MRRLFLIIGLCLMLSAALIGGAILPGWFANRRACLLVTTSERYAPVTHRYVTDALTGFTLGLNDALQWFPISSSPRARLFVRFLPQYSDPNAMHYEIGVTTVDESGYANIHDMVLIQPNIILNIIRDFFGSYWRTNLLWSDDWQHFGFRWQDASGQAFFTTADESGTSVRTQRIDTPNLATNELVSWSSDARYVLMRDLASGENVDFLIWDTQTDRIIKFDATYIAQGSPRGILWSPTVPILAAITPELDGTAQLTLFSMVDNVEHMVKLPKNYEPWKLWWSPTGEYVTLQGFQRGSSRPSLIDPGIYRFATSTGELLSSSAEWMERGIDLDFDITLGMWSWTSDRWYFLHIKPGDSRINFVLDALDLKSGEVEEITDHIVDRWLGTCLINLIGIGSTLETDMTRSSRMDSNRALDGNW